jgi:alanyl-tRNA synthetase
MTERLYYKDAYRVEFDASVASRSDGGRRVYLDRTAFYPTSGGQPFDTGELDDARVVEVVDEGDRIAHLLDRPLGSDRVRGRVEWARRFDHMQQHTGQHLLSAVMADHFGLETVSVHFGAEVSTLDLAAETLSHDRVVEAERRANAVVTENRPVLVSFEDAASAAGLRKASERSGTLRIVTIAELDRSACGGTHVRATGEIGPILIRRVERVKQQIRLEFLCGMRAVRRARADADLLARLAGAQSAAPDELPALLEAQRGELKAARTACRELEEAVARSRAKELYDAAAPDARGRRVVVLREAHGPVERFRPLAQALAEMPHAIFIAATAEPAAVLAAAAADSGLDAGRALKAALERHGGKGGGNPRLAQGRLPDADAVAMVLDALLKA